MTLLLSFACKDYEWSDALINSEVEPDGINLTELATKSGDKRYRRMIAGEFDGQNSRWGYITG